MGTKGRKQTPNWFRCFWMKKGRDVRGTRSQAAAGAKRLTRRLLQSGLVLTVCLLFARSGSSLLRAGQPGEIFSSAGWSNTDTPCPGQHAKERVLQYKKRTPEAEADSEDGDREKQGETGKGEKGGWTAMKPVSAVNVDTVEVAGGYALYNFNSCSAVGISDANRDIRETETDYGFVLKVLDADSVSIHIYNNTNQKILPVILKAQRSGGNETKQMKEPDLVIRGYASQKNGYGVISVQFANGRTVDMGVYKNGNLLYAANRSRNIPAVTKVVKNRQTLEGYMASKNLTPDQFLATENLYYPIYPEKAGENTDIDYWVKKSSELTDTSWSTEHKAAALYKYCLDTFAYDSFSCNNKTMSRIFYYNDFSGKYNISQTGVGICSDFANVFAIMCRAQNIPAVTPRSVAEKHQWAAFYSENYARWISVDISNDIHWFVGTEDLSKRSPAPGNYAFESFDREIDARIETIMPGNIEDMLLHGVQGIY
jgi:hypothetical protein